MSLPLLRTAPNLLSRRHASTPIRPRSSLMPLLPAGPFSIRPTQPLRSPLTRPRTPPAIRPIQTTTPLPQSSVPAEISEDAVDREDGAVDLPALSREEIEELVERERAAEEGCHRRGGESEGGKPGGDSRVGKVLEGTIEPHDKIGAKVEVRKVVRAEEFRGWMGDVVLPQWVCGDVPTWGSAEGNVDRVVGVDGCLRFGICEGTGGEEGGEGK